MTKHNLNSNDVVIVSAVRTPMTSFQGDFSALSVIELGSAAISSAIEKAGIDAKLIDEVIMGNVLSAGAKQAPARQSAIAAGVPVSTPTTTVNKLCGSGMKTAILAHDQIKAGSYDLAVAGGMESMTNAPHLLPSGRSGIRLGHGEIKDHMMYDGLEDAFSGRSMGAIVQDLVDQKGVTREEMDAYAIESVNRAIAATDNGYFADEIVPVAVKSRKGTQMVEVDEQPGKTQVDKIPQLRPAFAKDGNVTAANSSSISDGAAAIVLMSAAKAEEIGATPLARIVAHSTHAQAPDEFALAPVCSLETVLQKAGWNKDEVDLFEINEAFAAVTLFAMNALELDHDKVNVNGGACALGHPIGASGTRIIVTLIHALRRLGKTKGIASLCIGGGEATSMALEIL